MQSSRFRSSAQSGSCKCCVANAARGAEQLWVKLHFGGRRPEVRFAPESRHSSEWAARPKSADSVAKVFLHHRTQFFRTVGAAIE
jgi:hypothetical protein